MKNLVIAALLVPSLAYAQSTDPNDPNNPNAPTPTAPAPIEAPPPPPAPQTQQPVVVVNPQEQTTAPAPIPYSPQYETVYDDYNASMFFTGAFVFAGAYGASAIVAANDNSRGKDRLFVPVVGPWLALNDRGSCDITLSKCDNETTAKVLLVADGVFQAAGIIGMLDGVLQPSSHRVIARTADTKVHVTPTYMGNGGQGLAVFGHF